MNQSIEELIAQQRILDVVHNNMAELSRTDQAMFAMVRRSGLGASDASVYMGVNQWTTVEDLIAEKRSIGLTDKEIEVGNKEVVRKGSDLEPIILDRFARRMDVNVEKPAPMYRIKEHPYLTINFDGVLVMADQPIPVEAKFVSSYADKYWDRSKMLSNLFEGSAKICGGVTMEDHINDEAKLYGIPPYYYTQVQQQMLGLDAPFGYFATIFDKGWVYGAYKIFKDEMVQTWIKSVGKQVWDRVKAPN
jgi:hypothetical protein